MLYGASLHASASRSVIRSVAISPNEDGGMVQHGNTSMHSKPLDPHELDKIATVTLAHYEQHAEESRPARAITTSVRTLLRY